ncbi:MAG: OmpA family protein [Bacteroidetes bacterium]|nr:OmpA family protein [Bacteroidota bacterium]
MKRLYVFFLLYTGFIHVLSAQVSSTKTLFVEGSIKDQSNQKPIVNAIVHLKTEHGDILDTESDTAGYYAFLLSACTFDNAQIYISLSKKTHGLHQACNCYLNSSEVKSFKIDSSEHIIADFFLSTFSDCLCNPIPKFAFKKNSSEMDRLNYTQREDSVYSFPEWNLFQLAQIMKNEPNVVIEIDGHAGMDECMAEELSQLRAERVKSELIRLGINASRIVAKGWGNSKLLVKPDTIKKAKLRVEKKALHAKNRRCVFKVLSWDYEPAKRTEH